MLVSTPLFLNSDFFFAGGTLARDAMCYIVRSADADLLRALRRGEFCYVLTSRQMGKSSLMVRTVQRLREEGVAVAVLDLTAIGQNLTPEQWYDGLMARLGKDFHLEDELDDFWIANERLAPMQRFFQALLEVILTHVAGEIVIFVDEVDVVRSLPFSADELFAGMRELYTRRDREPFLNRLTFGLFGVASPSDLIRDVRTTPFNIGVRIELQDFNAREAAPLALALSTSFSGQNPPRTVNGKQLLSRVLYWTGGHPYLTLRLCRALAGSEAITTPADVDGLVKQVFLSPATEQTDNNLLFARRWLLESSADTAGVLELYRRIRTGKRVVDDETNPLLATLRLSGIVQVSNGRLQIRNPIYAHVFDTRWIERNMPDVERRRQQAAFQRGVMRAAAIFTAVILLLALLSYSLVLQTERARKAERLATQNATQLADTLVQVKHERDQAHDAEKQAQQAAQRERYQRQQADLARYNAELSAAQARVAAHHEQIANQRARKKDQEAKQAAVREVQEALRERQAVQTAARNLYHTGIGLAYQAWNVGNRERAIQLLTDAFPYNHQPDFRGFEWRLLWRLCHDNQAQSALQGHKELVSAVAVMPDAKLIVSSSTDKTVRLWNAHTGLLARELPKQESPLVSVALAPNGHTLAASGADGLVTCWDTGSRLPDSASQTSLPEFSLKGHEGIVWCIAFAHNSKLMATAGQDQTVRIWDVSSKRCVMILRDSMGAARGVAFSPDDTLLATGSDDKHVRLWSVATGKLLHIFPPHPDKVWTVAFTPKGQQLASGSGDGTIKFWNVAQRKQISTAKAHQGVVNWLSYAPDGNLFVTVGGEGQFKIWDAATCQEMATIETHDEGTNFVTWFPDGNTLVTGGHDGKVRIWRALPVQEMRSLTASSRNKR